MAGMTQGMALVEFVMVCFLRNGGHIFSTRPVIYSTQRQIESGGLGPDRLCESSAIGKDKADHCEVINDGPTLPCGQENFVGWGPAESS